MKRSQIKKFSDCISPLNWMFVAIAVIPSILILLRPTWGEFASLFIVDGLTTFAFLKFEGGIFTRLHPDSAFYFNGTRDEDVRRLSLGERIQLVQSLLRFPDLRARYCYFYSFLKAIPAFALVVFGWSHPGHSDLSQFAIVLLISAINWIYFYRMVQVDNHAHVSELIARFHEIADFSEAFDKYKVDGSRLRLSRQEYFFLAFLFIFTLALQAALVVSGEYGTGLHLIGYQLVIGTAGLLLFSRAWIVGRMNTIDGLYEIHSRLERVDRSPDQALPLSSTPLLALFGQTLNRLTRRISEHEKELSAMVLRQAEKSRFRYLGEMTALLAHDLSGPLHVAQFSASQLSENPDMPTDKREKYLHHLVSSLGRAVELTTSLRSRVRNPESESRYTRFREAHDNVLNLLHTQIGLGEFTPVKFALDPKVEDLTLEIPRVDLIHVLDNLYRNAFENLTEKGVKSPEIQILTVNHPPGEPPVCEIHIRDNGSGLLPRDFERLTTFRSDEGPRAGKQETGSSGLGLRLTRRLVEINGGDLSILEQPGPGTTLRLRLKQYIPTATGLAQGRPVVVIHHHSKTDPTQGDSA